MVKLRKFIKVIEISKNSERFALLNRLIGRDLKGGASNVGDIIRVALLENAEKIRLDSTTAALLLIRIRAAFAAGKLTFGGKTDGEGTDSTACDEGSRR